MHNTLPCTVQNRERIMSGSAVYITGAGIISATWESQVQAIRADRENYVLAIADNVKWNSTDRKAFIASCPDKALAKHLAGADKFFTKLTRKLFNRS